MKYISDKHMKKYLKNSSELHSTFINAYMNYFYLTEISKKYKDLTSSSIKIFIFQDILSFINTIIFNFQRDFVLLFWKIGLDKTSSNSLLAFRNRINEKYLLNGIKVNEEDFVIDCKISKIVKKIRHKSIAHLDANKENLSLDLKDVFLELTMLCEYFNKMLFDDAIQYEITEILINTLESKSKNGIEETIKYLANKENA